MSQQERIIGTLSADVAHTRPGKHASGYCACVLKDDPTIPCALNAQAASSWCVLCCAGCVWTALVLLVVPLFGPRQRGMAVGVLELVGYTSIAATAQVKGKASVIIIRSCLVL